MHKTVIAPAWATDMAYPLALNVLETYVGLKGWTAVSSGRIQWDGHRTWVEDSGARFKFPVSYVLTATEADGGSYFVMSTKMELNQIPLRLQEDAIAEIDKANSSLLLKIVGPFVEMHGPAQQGEGLD